ncbi:hypothetical protein [Paenibacillus naphthalenovorans]|uniref:hypothetical protein n=1 Tax=Paenibacillus naphthalenovorans TaxID=162209 RepID=UPI003D2D7F6D
MTLQEPVNQVLEQRFGLSETGIAGAEHRFRLGSLLRPEEMSRFIRIYTEALKGSHIDVGGMFFIAWVAQVCSALQYTVSCHQAALNLHLDQLELQLRHHSDGPALAFRADSCVGTPCPADNREEWLSAIFHHWYIGQVKPLIASVSEAAGIPTAQLWAQLVTRLYYTIDVMIGEAEDEETRSRIKDDFAVLVHRIGPRIFEKKNNLLDLNFKMVESPADPDRLLRVKAACCLYYKTEKACGNYCFTCPKLSDKDREEKRRKLLTGTL